MLNWFPPVLAFTSAGVTLMVTNNIKKYYRFRAILLSEVSRRSKQWINEGRFDDWPQLYRDLDNDKASPFFFFEKNLPRPFRGRLIDREGLVDAAFARYLMGDPGNRDPVD